MIVEGTSYPLGEINGQLPCDLRLVDAILRLRLELQRAGACLRLGHVDAPLRALLDLVGVGDCIDVE